MTGLNHMPFDTAPNRDRVDLLISEIKTLQQALQRPELGKAEGNDALRIFFFAYASPLLECLTDLKNRYEADDGGSGGGAGSESGGADDSGKGTHRMVIEGFSDESAEIALSNALDKAAHCFAENHDVNITLQQLLKLPKGGHRAVLELYITPFRHHLSEHVAGNDVDLMRIQDRDFVRRRKVEREHIRHMVFDHFAATTGGSQKYIPDYFLINVKDADLMNMMVESDFFAAGRAPDEANRGDDHHPLQFKVRVQSGPRPSAR